MISAKTKQLGIIGCPVEHSFSPRMHNYLSARMGNDYVYSAWRVERDSLKEAIAGIRALGIHGINVTAPHKVEVMQYLDEISPEAKLLGSVNTVVRKGNKLIGYNTDAEGFCRAAFEKGIIFEGKKILTIGAGGVTKPTLMRIAQEKPLSITLLNRTTDKARRIAEEIKQEMGFMISTDVFVPDFDIVINMTSAGMEPQLDALPTDNIKEIKNLDFINSNTAVIDMIYNPGETLFLREAKKRGARVMNGLGMLIHQGLVAYELFTNTKLPKGIAEEISKEIFSR